MWLMKQLKTEAGYRDKSIYVQNFKVPIPLHMDCFKAAVDLVLIACVEAPQKAEH